VFLTVIFSVSDVSDFPGQETQVKQKWLEEEGPEQRWRFTFNSIPLEYLETLTSYKPLKRIKTAGTV
jgi:hypothetical protein